MPLPTRAGRRQSERGGGHADKARQVSRALPDPKKKGGTGDLE